MAAMPDLMVAFYAAVTAVSDGSIDHAELSQAYESDEGQLTVWMAVQKHRFPENHPAFRAVPDVDQEEPDG